MVDVRSISLKLTAVDHGLLCYGWSWTINDIDKLAEQVAYIRLGLDWHVAKILKGADIPWPNTQKALVDDAINRLTLDPGQKTWHRDGWLFQAISWIAAHNKPSGSLTQAPQIREADKGFDGLQIEISEDGKAISAVTIFEDKATKDPRRVIRDEVWPDFQKLENNERLTDLTQSVSNLLREHAKNYPQLNLYTAIEKTIWEEARRYRISTTINDRYKNEEERAKLFERFDEAVPGPVIRRRADTFHLKNMRTWMNRFAELVISKLEDIKNVRSND